MIYLLNGIVFVDLLIFFNLERVKLIENEIKRMIGLWEKDFIYNKGYCCWRYM